MYSVLPNHLTADAVPEKRTADEENQPPSLHQAQEYVGRHIETVRPASECDLRGERREQENCSNCEQTSTKEAKQDKAQPDAKDKPKKTEKKKKKPTTVNIVNISNSSGFQISANTRVSNHWNINQVQTMFSHPKPPHHQQADPRKHSSVPVPEAVFQCLDRVSDEDCTIVSEYLTCDWKILGEQLFPCGITMLKDYIVSMEGKSKKEALRMILIKWKQVNYKVADVRQLCLVLQKLNEIDALIRLANRHGIK